MDDKKQPTEREAMRATVDETRYIAKLRDVAARLDREVIAKRLRKLGVRIGEVRK